MLLLCKTCDILSCFPTLTFRNVWRKNNKNNIRCKNVNIRVILNNKLWNPGTTTHIKAIIHFYIQSKMNKRKNNRLRRCMKIQKFWFRLLTITSSNLYNGKNVGSLLISWSEKRVKKEKLSRKHDLCVSLSSIWLRVFSFKSQFQML